ncbi:MAG TPA: hypothetical protein VG722_08175 [Tepidisphaeraceae bacterium]|nr:hypothetical protein [Tepidisphaeraceae bacterium]
MMRQTAVEDILERIAKLPEDDRVLLEERLGKMLEGEWEKAADEARQEAKRRGLDQTAIDRAVREVRRSRRKA